MKRIASVIVMFITINMGCVRRSVPVITERNTALPQKRKIYAAPGTVVADTLQGKELFMSRCNRCHGLPDIVAYTPERWEDILENMIPRSGTDKTEAVHLRSYVMTRTVK